MVRPGDYQRPDDNRRIHTEDGNSSKGEGPHAPSPFSLCPRCPRSLQGTQPRGDALGSPVPSFLTPASWKPPPTQLLVKRKEGSQRSVGGDRPGTVPRKRGRVLGIGTGVGEDGLFGRVSCILLSHRSHRELVPSGGGGAQPDPWVLRRMGRGDAGIFECQLGARHRA